jgi:hypothetical protein
MLYALMNADEFSIQLLVGSRCISRASEHSVPPPWLTSGWPTILDVFCSKSLENSELSLEYELQPPVAKQGCSQSGDDLNHQSRGSTIASHMPAGAARRVWFPELGERFRSRWQNGMPFETLIESRHRTDRDRFRARGAAPSR